MNLTVSTVSYCAPEQLTGHGIDGRADPYALAGTAFQLLTGALRELQPGGGRRRPPRRATPLTSEKRPDLARLDGVLASALAKTAAERLVRCEQFAAALPPSDGQRLDQRPTHPGRHLACPTDTGRNRRR